MSEGLEFTLEISGLVELEKKMRFPNLLDDVIPYALEETGERVVALSRALVRVRMGVLRDSIRHSRESTTARIYIYVGAHHGIFVEAGTRPHVIRARYAKMLRWVVTGAVHYAYQVKHPGTRAYPFFQPAVREAPRMLRETLSVEASRILEESA